MSYATVTPKEGAKQPLEGWRFKYDSNWNEIGPGHYFEPEMAEHARSFFTPRDPNTELECLVDVEYHEGSLTLAPPALAAQKFPFDGTDYDTIGEMQAAIVAKTRAEMEEPKAKPEPPKPNFLSDPAPKLGG